MGRRQTLEFNNKACWKENEKLEDESLIYEFEEAVGHKLPESFKELTKSFHHGSTKKAEFYVNGDMSPELRFMLSFNKDAEYFNIWKRSYYGLTDFEPYVVIAQDIAGNLIALDYSKSETEPGVVFVDHEMLGMIFLDEDKEYTEEEIEAMETSERLKDFPWAIYPVADSFLEFLNGLDGEIPYEPDAGEWYNFEETPKITKYEIEEVEHAINVKFPDYYKKVMLEYQGLFVDENYIKSKEFEITHFLAINSTDRYYIVKWFNKFSKEYLGKIIPFAIGKGIDLIAFDYTKLDSDNPSVIYI